MALPYKLLKSLTIDGETMGLDPDIGSVISGSKSQGITSANTKMYGAEITITEPGLYLVFSRWMYKAPSSTGNRNLKIAVEVTNSGGTPNGGAYITSMVGSGIAAQLRLDGFYIVTEANAPRKFQVTATSDKTSAADWTNVDAVKIMKLV